jgi:hypothetical protein
VFPLIWNASAQALSGDPELTGEEFSQAQGEDLNRGLAEIFEGAGFSRLEFFSRELTPGEAQNLLNESPGGLTPEEQEELAALDLWILPFLHSYATSVEEGTYTLEVQGEIRFLSSAGRGLGSLVLASGIGGGDGPEEAWDNARRELLETLERELRTLPLGFPELRIEEVLLPGEMVFSAGRRRGLRRGDEFWILPAGEGEVLGLAALSWAGEDFALGELLLRRGPQAPAAGDRLLLISRLGVEAQVSLSFLLPDPALSRRGLLLIPELRLIPARGFYKYRPILGLRTLVDLQGTAKPPLGVFAGGEINWYFRRLSLSPSLTLGINLQNPEGQAGRVHSLQGGVELKGAFLIGHRLRISLKGGLMLFKAWESAAPGLGAGSSPGRFSLGAGADLKL